MLLNSFYCERYQYHDVWIKQILPADNNTISSLTIHILTTYQQRYMYVFSCKHTTKNLFSHENLFETNNEVSTQHFSTNKNLLPLRIYYISVNQHFIARKIEWEMQIINLVYTIVWPLFWYMEINRIQINEKCELM